ncbi:MAG: hypothetical protein KKA64_02380 [Nanoarchaeota archaeon]|nr:hypothetical protein [Nanoarchaeota archaeon]
MDREKETRGIRAILIIEVLGKPAEHLTQTLQNLIKNIEEEPKVQVIEQKINEPILIKDQKNFYTSFAEIEVEVEEILYLAVLMFKYMPAHIEIINPELIALTNNGWNDILNELTRRLHGYEEIARIIQAERGILEKRLKEVLSPQQIENLFAKREEEIKEKSTKKKSKKK